MNQTNNNFEGGFSPRFEAIKTHPEKAKLFLHNLFFHQKNHLKENVCKILFASILRFYQQFEALLSFEPNEKYKGMCSLLFIFTKV